MRTLGAATVVLALAAGCTGDPEPVPTMPVVVPTATPSPSPTPDPATVPPERPDLSRVDAATAEALAVYFLELYPYVYATGDLTEWRALSHPDCKFCASTIKNVEEMVAAGEHWEGGLAEFSTPKTTTVSFEFYTVHLSMTESVARRIDAGGQVVEEAPGGTSDMVVMLAAKTGSLLVRGVDVGDEE